MSHSHDEPSPVRTPQDATGQREEPTQDRRPEHEPADVPSQFRLPDRFLLIVDGPDGQEEMVCTPEEMHVIDQAWAAHEPGAVIERDDTVTVDGLSGLWEVDGFTEFAWSGSPGRSARPPTVEISQTIAHGTTFRTTAIEVYPTRVHLVRKGNIAKDILDLTEKALAAPTREERLRLDEALHALYAKARTPAAGRIATSQSAVPGNLTRPPARSSTGDRPAPPSLAPPQRPSPRR